MTELHEPQGPVHTGPGDMYIGSTVVVQHFDEARCDDLNVQWMTPRDDLLRLKQRFVPPHNLGLAREKLLVNHTVLLTGERGSGRLAAARMLLNELDGASGPISYLIDEADDQENRLRQARVADRQRLLLDLSDSDEPTLHARQRELPGFRAKIQERQAYLVVVLPPRREYQVSVDLSWQVVTIDRPRGRAVLRRHLAAEGIELAETDLDSDALAPCLDGPMREIAMLAGEVAKARDQDRQGCPSNWLKEALAETSDRREEAAEQVSSRVSARERSVLFSVAMLGQASTDGVFFASQGLLDLVSTTGEKPRLEQVGHLEQLKDLVQKVQAHDSVRFQRPEYGLAMRRHFWDNYPDLRRTFSVWVGETLKIGQLDRADRKALVGHYVEDALRTGSVDDLKALINRWANPARSEPSYWIEFATTALIAGLNDARHGKVFRRLVYDWSTTKQPEHVGQLLVKVCTDVIAPDYPEQALVRLHHRSRSEEGHGNPTARSALLQLISDDPSLFRLLLDRLASSLDGGSPSPTDLSLFLDAATPSRLIRTESQSLPLAAEPEVRQQLISGWRVILTHGPDLAWQAVREWLHAAGQTTQSELLLGILVEAARHDVGLLGALHVVARDWSSTQTGVRNITPYLSWLIDTAQGIHTEDLANP